MSEARYTDTERLYKRAKWAGTELGPDLLPLTTAEVASVADALSSCGPEADPHLLLLTLGRAGATEYRPLVERFLHCESDPMLARAALIVLCDDWRLAEAYVSELEQFVLGVDWDTEEDVRLQAISSFGSYLRDHRDESRLRLVYQVFSDASERTLVREAAYEAMVIATGRRPQLHPRGGRGFPASIDPQVVEEIEGRLR